MATSKILLNTVRVGQVTQFAGTYFHVVQDAEMLRIVDSVGGRLVERTASLDVIASLALAMRLRGEAVETLDALMVANNSGSAGAITYDDSITPHLGVETTQDAIDVLKQQYGAGRIAAVIVQFENKPVENGFVVDVPVTFDPPFPDSLYAVAALIVGGDGAYHPLRLVSKSADKCAIRLSSNGSTTLPDGIDVVAREAVVEVVS